MAAFRVWAPGAGQIGEWRISTRAAIRSPSRPSIALDPIGRSVELVLSTLLGHSASHSERLFLPQSCPFCPSEGDPYSIVLAGRQ
jgi:hypothetical protein